MARLYIILFTLVIISQVITDKGSPLILQGEPKAKDILELDEDITEFNNTQNTNDSEKSISESSGDSSADSSKSINKSNAESSKNSNKDSQAQKEQMVLEVVRKWEYKTKQTKATAELLARIMEHDLDSYNKLATVPNFKVIISNDYSSNKE